MQKAVQQIMLGTVTGNEREAGKTLEKIKQAGYDGVELNGFMIRPVSFLVRTLTRAAGMPTGRGGKLDWKKLMQEAGLCTVSIHEDLGTIKREPQTVIREAERFGTDKIVITGMYRFDYGDEDALKAFTEDLNASGRVLKKEGIDLLYHNHNCEFRRLADGKTAYDYLLEHTDPAYVNFEFDSYWPTEAGISALSLMEKLGDRMKLYHINDRGTRLTGASVTPILKSDSMELGYGNMDLDALMQKAMECGIEAVILESHKNWAEKSPIRSLELSAEFLKKYVD